MKRLLKNKSIITLLFMISLFSCEHLSKNKVRQSRVNYGVNDTKDVLTLSGTALEESNYVSENKIKGHKDTIKILSIVSFSQNISQLISYLKILDMSEYDYFTGEGIGLILSVYLQYGYNLEDIKWDFYKLNQVLHKEKIKLFSEKGLSYLEKIILSKFQHERNSVKKVAKRSFLILPNCNNNIVIEDISKVLLNYTKTFLLSSNQYCENHLDQINKFMTRNYKTSMIMMFQKNQVNRKIKSYFSSLNTEKIKDLKEFYD